jgi:hypothetical protein
VSEVYLLPAIIFKTAFFYIYCPYTFHTQSGMKLQLDITGKSFESHIHAPRTVKSGFRPQWKSFLAPPPFTAPSKDESTEYIYKGNWYHKCQGRLTNKLYMDQNLKLRPAKEEIWSVKTGREVRQ